VEGLSQYWGFYFVPEAGGKLGSSDLSFSLDLMEGCIGGSLHLWTPFPPASRLELNQMVAQIVFQNSILARLLVLEAFLLAGAGVSASLLRQRWTHLQLVPSALRNQFSGDARDIFRHVYEVVAQQANTRPWITSILEKIRQDPRIPSHSPLFVVLDEAQLCSHLYEGAFHSETETGSEGRRSVLREISKVWKRLGPFTMIYSGTGISLTKVEKSLASCMAETRKSHVFTDTGAFVTQEQQAAYIKRHVSLPADKEKEILDRAWSFLRGR
jgi:hypothetical protein